MTISVQEFKKKETELCDRVWDLCAEIDRLSLQGKSTVEAFRQLEATLIELRVLTLFLIK